MKVKKYIAASMPEVMNLIRQDLGVDAVILNSKEVQQGGFLGLFKKRMIEVVAAYDPDPVRPVKQNKPTSAIAYVEPIGIRTQIVKESDDQVMHELKQLKKIIEQQANYQNQAYAVDFQITYQHLLEQEVEENLAKELIDTVLAHFTEHETDPTLAMIQAQLGLELERRLEAVSFHGMDYTKKVIQFVGPTGVGKTTTIAKLAAYSMLKDNKKVAFITADTYRIAAIDQLKTYAKILEIPFEVAYTLEDYSEALEKFKAFDLILVDTAGRNFRDEKYIQELKESIDFNSQIETYLVLSLTAKPKDILDIYEQFNYLPIKKVIFTKLDETRQYGSILNISLKNELGIAYLTNGQDVPDDLIEPTPKQISQYILGGNIDA